MNFLTMTVPEDPSDLRDWLDEVVARGQAGRLADELSATRGQASTVVSTVPGELASIIRATGFSGLSDGQMRIVLAHPDWLTALAEDVFEHGGPFWAKRFDRESTFDGSIERLRNQLFPASAPSVLPARTRQSIAPWVASLATAAALLLAIYTIPALRRALGPNEQPVVAKAWGWQKSGELASAGTPGAYLNRIADLAEEWNRQDTSTAVALADRIAEFRQGCARLQLLEHKPLSDAQRTDLLTRCQKWAKKFDQNLSDLETTGDVERIRTAMNETVTQLTKALRDLAAKA